jgi:hypothetical protein
MKPEGSRSRSSTSTVAKKHKFLQFTPTSSVPDSSWQFIPLQCFPSKTESQSDLGMENLDIKRTIEKDSNQKLDRGRQLESDMTEESKSKSSESSNAVPFKSNAVPSKRNMFILFGGILISILLIPLIFPRNLDRVVHKVNRMKSFNIFKSWLSDNTNSWIRILVVVLIFSLSMHRILGFLFAIAVRKVLGRKLKGSFLVNFKWIAVRLGFDSNEVVFHDIMFHNPPQFTDTPYFMSVGHAVVR